MLLIILLIQLEFDMCNVQYVCMPVHWIESNLMVWKLNMYDFHKVRSEGTDSEYKNP